MSWSCPECRAPQERVTYPGGDVRWECRREECLAKRCEKLLRGDQILSTPLIRFSNKPNAVVDVNDPLVKSK